MKYGWCVVISCSIDFFIFIIIIFFSFKDYQPRANKNRFKKKSCLSPNPLKRTVREIEAGGGGPI